MFFICKLMFLMSMVCCSRTIIRQNACRRRRALQECSVNAGEWQYKFSNLLAGVVPNTMEAVYHRDREEIVYVSDVQKERLGELLNASP